MRQGVMRSTTIAGAVLLAAGWILAQTALPAAQGGAAPVNPPRDLTGVWFKGRPPEGVRQFDGSTWTPGTPPPLSAWGLEQAKLSRPNNSGEFELHETNDPVLTKCYPPGTPRVYFHPYPFEFVKTGNAWLQIFEYDHTIRRLFSDGRPLPEDPDLLWMGTSVGQWVNDHLFEVVTVGFNDKTWIDRAGTPHSDQLKVTERFRRVAYDRLELEIVMEDPVALAKPWVAKGYYDLRSEWELGEISCSGDYLEWPGA